MRATGRSLAEWQAHSEGGIAGAVDLSAFVVEIDRDTLYDRCDRRFDLMLLDGALGEVAALARRALPRDLPVMKALGVPPLLDHLDGRQSLEEAAAIARRDTRRYAKRQLTWFRHQAHGWKHIASGSRL